MTYRNWETIDTAPKDGTPIECLWPGYGDPDMLHHGVCIFKRDWYALGRAVELETWWTGPEFKNPTARDPTHWRPVLVSRQEAQWKCQPKNC